MQLCWSNEVAFGESSFFHGVRASDGTFQRNEKIKVGGAEKGERATPVSLERKCDQSKSFLTTLWLNDGHVVIFTTYL
jgi:hypothetical protein